MSGDLPDRIVCRGVTTHSDFSSIDSKPFTSLIPEIPASDSA